MIDAPSLHNDGWKRGPVVLDEEALRAPATIEVELLHPLHPGRITDLPEPPPAEEVLRMHDRIPTTIDDLATVVAHDVSQELACDSPTAMVRAHHEIRDVMIPYRLEATDLRKGEAIEPLVGRIVAIRLVEVHVRCDRRVTKVVVPPREEEDRILAPSHQDGRDDLMRFSVVLLCEHKPVTGNAPERRDAFRRDNVTLDPLHDFRRKMTALVAARCLERTRQDRRDRERDLRNRTRNDAELEAIRKRNKGRGCRIPTLLIAEIRPPQRIRLHEPVPGIERIGLCEHDSCSFREFERVKVQR